MTEKTKAFYKQIESLLDRASEQLSAKEYLSLCEEVESSADARFIALAQELNSKNEDESNE